MQAADGRLLMEIGHDGLVAEIQRRAELRGLLSHYCKVSTSCKGHRGLPDLIVAGVDRTVFLEVKTGGADPSPDQTTWLYTLRAGGQDVYVIREHDIRDGSLDEILDGCARNQD